MARVLQLLEEFADRLPQESEPHPLCGGSTISVGRISGGTSVNIVPAECTIEIDRRIVPGEDGLHVISQLDSFLRERLDFGFEMLPPWMVGVPLSDENNEMLSTRLLESAGRVMTDRRRIGVPFGTHAARYAQLGVPSVVFGPGSIAQAHTDDEWLDIDQLEAAHEILYQFLTSWSS
jgi:acetylornithine deacetylase